jgi:two-component system, sensor histidine kinase PdtaS
MSPEAGTASGTDATVVNQTARPLPKAKPRWEAADSVIAASSGLVAIIVGVFVLLCLQGYNNAIENSKIRAQTAADVVAEGTRWAVSSALATLDGVAASIGDDPAQADADVLAAFEANAAILPAQLALGIYDESGNAVTAATADGAPASIADTDYFRTVAGGAGWSLSAQQRSGATGEATFAVARRLEADGAFTGAAVAIIDADVLDRLAEPQQLGEGSTISMVRLDGWIIARDPPLAAALDLGRSPAFQNLTAAESGSYVSETSPADGVSRIVSFRQVGELGYIAIAAISTQTALAGLWYAIWVVSLLIAPIAVALLIGSFITARLLRRSQSTSRSLAAALEHNETLFREIHHRVKNNLQSVNSLLQLQPIPRAVRNDMGQRIAAMSAVHEHIYRSRTFSEVRVKDYLHTLIDNIRAGYDPKVEVLEDIEDVAVEKDAATPLGLIINEVVSNTFKHAFSDGRAGEVSISLKAEGDGRARLTVRDNGVGFDPSVPSKGIGRRLVEGFAAQLRGESSHTSDESGSVFTLTFPLAREKGAPTSPP